jgi:cytidine deaminase
LFFALVGPVGTDLRQVQSILEQELRTVAYEPVEVRMSMLLKDVKDFAARLRRVASGPEHERIKAFMDCGDALRDRANTGAAMAFLSAVFVREYRSQNPTIGKARARAFIFNSLKHPEEVHLLRRLYGDALIVVSVYSPRRARLKALARRIAKTRGVHDSASDEQLAEDLMDRDAKGPNGKFGQRVADTFHLADYFVRDGAKPDLHRELQRLIEIVFQHPYRTPTRDEFAMFQARGVALRSADLSRQVGAVICEPDGSIVATGCNEVPKPGGGTYWEGDKPDYRDFQQGSDANALEKRSLVGELLEQMQAAKWLAPRIQKLGAAAILAKAIDGKEPLLKETRAAALLEFGRVVHAEMNAPADAARRGIAVNPGSKR